MNVKVSIKCYNKGKVVSYMTELQKTIINLMLDDMGITQKNR